MLKMDNIHKAVKYYPYAKMVSKLAISMIPGAKFMWYNGMYWVLVAGCWYQYPLTSFFIWYYFD